MNNDGHDVGKDIGRQTKSAGKAILRNKRIRRLLSNAGRAAAKFLKFMIEKILLSILKILASLLGPYAFIIILLIVLLLIVVDSISVFDIHQKAAERTEAEELFDNTIKDVIQTRSQDSAYRVIPEITATQPDYPFPRISSAWLHQTATQLEPSWAVPAILQYYKNLKNTNYKPWHEEFSHLDVSNEMKKNEVNSKFLDIINKEYDYYFNDQAYQAIPTFGTAPQEYKEVKEIKVCWREVVDEDGNTSIIWDPPIETVDKEPLPERKIINSVQLFYKTAHIQYTDYISPWVDVSTKEINKCHVSLSERYHLNVVDDTLPAQIELDATTLVSFLVATAPEGKLSKRVHPRDLEYVVELGKEIDDSFPTLSIDFEKFIKCSKTTSVESCIGQYVIGGNLGVPSGLWYPEQYKDLYIRAGDRYGVDWWIIAAIHGQETNFSTNPVATDRSLASKNSRGEIVGARGHFQFMPRTWMGWSFTGSNEHNVTSLGNIIGPIDFIMDLDNIARYGGYGVDASGTGIADPWDLEDAAFTAARYLSANGYVKGDEAAIKKAIGAYNHSSKYVNEVWNRGIMFRDGPVGGIGEIPIADGVFTFPTTGRITSSFGLRGSKFHNGIDIGGGGRNYDVPIVSVADGVVSRSEFSSSYGWVVYIKHDIEGIQLETVYAHMDRKPNVANGQSVNKGETIGYMGNTGDSSGKHLHFEMHSPSWNSGKTNKVNPLLYIPMPPLE